MSKSIDSEIIAAFRSTLEQHPVYAAVATIEDLRCFMQHHIYSVWDFMSLIKYLQGIVAPATWPWLPAGDSRVQRFINELVLEEESDSFTLPGTGTEQSMSHFELYCGAMRELGAQFVLGEGGVAEVSTRIKMAKTSDVIAVVKTDAGLFSTSKEVKVTIGGCGG